MHLSQRSKSVFVCLLIALVSLFIQPARTPSVQAARAITLNGEAAIEALHQRGEYRSLAAAYRAARSVVSAKEAQQTNSYQGQTALHPPDYAAYENFGQAVAISEDTAVIGVPNDKIGPFLYQGSAYVFVRNGTLWSFQQKLVLTDGTQGDNFGFAVAVGGDTIIIGAVNYARGTASQSGAAFVFTRSGEGWTQQAKLSHAAPESNDYFGWSVAISGDTVAIGCPYDNISNMNDRGSVTIYTRNAQGWVYQMTLTASDGSAGHKLGTSVALGNDLVIAGAPGHDEPGLTDPGAAYVFIRAGTNWSQQRMLTARQPAANELFGESLAFSGDTAVVGAPGADSQRGAAYVISRTGSNWAEPVRLTANDGRGLDLFGQSVDVGETTVAIGAPGCDASRGAVYVFARTGAAWNQQQRLIVNDRQPEDGLGSAVSFSGDTILAGAGKDNLQAEDEGSATAFVRSGNNWTPQNRFTAQTVAAHEFGTAVALSGTTAVIGAPQEDKARGTAYVFVRNGDFWQFQQQLFAADGMPGDWFGYAVAISGDTLAVGAYQDDSDFVDQGSVYVFVRTGTVWMPQQKLRAGDARTTAAFGRALALEGNTLVVGAPNDLVRTGAAYVFTRTDGSWSQRRKLTSAANESRFGLSVALSSNTIVAGAPFENIGNNEYQGAAYVFTGSGANWTQQARLFYPNGTSNYRFGVSVAVSDETLVVCALDNAAHLYLRSGVNWSPQSRLTATNIVDVAAIRGDTIVLGSAYVASVFVYTRTGANWSPSAILSDASANRVEDLFGISVAINESRDTILVGAAWDVVNKVEKAGTALVYVRAGSRVGPLACVSAASFATGALASESIIAAFGSEMATTTEAAATQPLPTTLAGVRLSLRDSQGVERFAPLFFVSPGQINFQIPPGTAPGRAQVTITHNNAAVAAGSPQIEMVAPGLFAANANGQGVLAGLALRLKADGSQTYENIARYDTAQNRFVAVPINLGPASDRVFLVLFGTGLRHRSSLSGVTATLGGVNAEVLYAGAQGGFAGLDQLNLALPRNLAGRGEVELTLLVDGKAANAMRVAIN